VKAAGISNGERLDIETHDGEIVIRLAEGASGSQPDPQQAVAAPERKADPGVLTVRIARERAHLAALSHLVQGGARAAAVAVLDRDLMRYPFDLVVHHVAALADGFLGRFHWVRDRLRDRDIVIPRRLPRLGRSCQPDIAATAWRIFA
jgi:hypothetical protein